MNSMLARLEVAEALAQLHDVARVVLWLDEEEGWSDGDIAALWGKSPSFSKSQLSRAYARLRSYLGAKGRTR